MHIIQVINNNVALIRKGGHEVFIVSKGIGFRKKKGEVIFEEEIEKMYILDSYQLLEHFSFLLSQSDPNDILLINKIIENAEIKLKIKTTDYLALALLDHINYLIDRAQKKQFITSPLIWNVKRFYPKHFEIGLESLDIISAEKGILFPKDEAVSIALHFINNDLEKDNRIIRNVEIKTFSDIISIIEKHFYIKLDENSSSFMRFSTHLQYFIQRIVNNETLGQNTEDLCLYENVCKIYPDSFKVVKKIKLYIQKEFNFQISISEETYLMIHINRLTERMTQTHEL